MSVICPYCKREAELTTGEYIYPSCKSLKDIKIYVCWDCDARVGCHKKTGEPLGTPANEELREWRKMAHATFDPIWIKGKLTRKEAYAKLSNEMNIHKDDCHIGHFDINMCKKVIEVCLLKLT